MVHRSHQAAKMKQTSGPTKKAPAGAVLKGIRRATRRQFTAEEKIRIVLEGLRGEESIAEGGVRATWLERGRGLP